jgi:hypothetical protein
MPISLDCNSKTLLTINIQHEYTFKAIAFYSHVLDRNAISNIYLTLKCLKRNVFYINENNQRYNKKILYQWLLYIDLTVYQCMRKMNLNLFYDFSNLVYIWIGISWLIEHSSFDLLSRWSKGKSHQEPDLHNLWHERG